MDDKPRSSESPNGPEGPYLAYVVIALVGAFGCVGVAFAVFVMAKWSNLTDSGLWALSASVFAPAVLAIGVSYWVYRTSCVPPKAQNDPPRESESKTQFGIKE